MVTDPQYVHFLYWGKISHLIGIVPNFLKLGVEIAFQYFTFFSEHTLSSLLHKPFAHSSSYPFSQV